MNTWQAESNFKQIHYGNSSRHTLVAGKNVSLTRIDSGTLGTPGTLDTPYTVSLDIDYLWTSGRSFIKSYWKNDKILSYRKRILSGVPNEALADGLYAHGVSACMGAHNIETGSNLLGSAPYRSISSSNGLLVPIGNRVTDIYEDTQEGRRRSILAGLIVLHDFFKFWNGRDLDKPVAAPGKALSYVTARYNLSLLSEQLPPITAKAKVTPSQALLIASGSYLGGYSLVSKDGNGSAGNDRARFCRDNRTWSSTSSVNMKRSSYSTPVPSGVPITSPGC